MNLAPVRDEPGLWRNLKHTPGSPGLYAVIIGVSVYDHLPGGPGRLAPNGGRFGTQLVSSALTAALVFDWLSATCDIDACEVAEVRLLLSPTAAELAEPRWPKSAVWAEATYVNAERAVRRWATAMKRLPAPVRGESRGLFFFSGHGLNNNRQPILLLRDYLNPDEGEPADDALSIEAMGQLADQTGTGETYFFLDACQNAAAALGGINPVGRAPLPIKNPEQPQPRFVAKFEATAPGAQAYQPAVLLPATPDEPFRGLTFFGQALLRALHEDDSSFPPAQGRVLYRPGPLDRFLTSRVPELLRAAAGGTVASVPQMKQLAGGFSFADQALVVARLTAKKAAAALAGPAPGVAAMGAPAAPKAAAPQPPPAAEAPQPAEPVAEAAQTSPVDVVRAAAKVLDDRFETLDPGGVPVTAATLTDAAIGHTFFQHEYASELWSQGKVSVHRLSGPIVDGNKVVVEDGSVSDDGRVYRIDVSFDLEERTGLWLQAAYADGKAFGMAIPTERGRPMRLRLGARFGDEPPHPLESISGRLRPDRDETGAWLVRLAEYSGAELGAEVAADEQALQAALGGKMGAPLQALVAATLLVSTGRLAACHDWTRNLSDDLKHMSDGAVLWAEHLRRLQAVTAEDDPSAQEVLHRVEFSREEALLERARHLGRIAERGAPFLQPVLLMADAQLQDGDALFLAAEDHPDLAGNLLKARRLVGEAMKKLWSKQPWAGGLLAVYYDVPFGAAGLPVMPGRP